MIQVELVNDINISGYIVQRDVFITGFNGMFDGNGYTIHGTNDYLIFLIFRTYGGSVIKYIVMDVDSYFCLVYVNDSRNGLLMSDTAAKGWWKGNLDGTNISPFIGFSFQDSTRALRQLRRHNPWILQGCVPGWVYERRPLLDIQGLFQP